MAEKYYTKNPKVSDTIVFDLYTPNTNCIFKSDPYEVTSITVYFVERNFVYDKSSFRNINISDPTLEVKYLELKQASYEYPNNQDLKEKLKIAQRDLLQKSLNKVEFDSLIAVAKFGSSENPVWTPEKKGFIIKKVIDNDSNIVNGHFKFKFEQSGLREGDYFISYSWRPNISSQLLSSSIYFSLSSNTSSYISPKNLETNEKKYPNLLNRYLPDLYKNYLSTTDVSPEILEKFNNAVGDAFSYTENLANNIATLIDSNLIPEHLLSYLGNLYRLEFKSNDPIRWRRQIAKAIPNFKMKGTLNGLNSALGDAGIILKKYTQLYQIYSKYTWVDVFYGDSNKIRFELSKISLPINDDNFILYYRAKNNSFVEIPISNIEIETSNNKSTLILIGISLKDGEAIKIIYQIRKIEYDSEQIIENYIRSLPVADLRNDLNIIHPLKNWNAKVIEEDDALINEIIPFKNAFHDPIVFGDIRTEFPYSENIYNMDEYNGSLRESENPCDIDKNFLDTCNGYLSTLYNLDVEIENLNSERIQEVFNVLKEFTPFHSILHSLNYSGFFETMILPPEEKIEALITYKLTETIISGNAQMAFNRNMFLGLLQRVVHRNALAIMDNLGNETIKGYNKEINLFSPLVDFSELGINSRVNTLLEILNPSSNTGKYTVLEPKKNLIRIYEEALISQPINQSEFAYRLSNINYTGTNFTIKQESIYTFKDELIINEKKQNNITTVIDVEKQRSNDCWKIKYYIVYPNTFNIYNIYDINPDGSIVLENDFTLPSLSEGLTIDDINYDLLNENNEKIYFSSNGSLTSENKGLVIGNDGNFGKSVERVKIGNYFYYLNDDTQYVVLGYGYNENEFYISNWENGDVIGTSGKILDRVVKEHTGNLAYNKIIIEKPSLLPVFEDSTISGSLDNDSFKENFILVINDVFYKIVSYFNELSVNYLEIEGLPLDLGTYLSGGTSISVNCKQFKKKENIIYTITLNYDEFIRDNGIPQIYLKPTGDYVIIHDLNRGGANQVSGKDQQNNEIYLCDSSPLNLDNLNNSVIALNNGQKKDGLTDIINQEENVSFTIETKDGNNTKGQV